MQMKPGLRLKSTVCEGEVMVVRAEEGGELTCGGRAMSDQPPSARSSGKEGQMHGCLMGKRYINAADSFEVLCIKSGEGSLYFGGQELMTKDTKKLPSSD